MMVLALYIGFLKISWVDFVDMSLVGFLFYHTFRLMQGTLAVRILVGFILLYFVYLLVKAARMDLLSSVLGQFAGVGVLALVILFQQEIRRFLFILGRTTSIDRRRSFFRNILRLFGTQSSEIILNIPEVLSAIEVFARTKTGALIVLSSHSPMSNFIELGDRLEAHVSKRLLLAIFNKFGPMHDGAAIIYENKIVVARCILPISEQANIPPTFGTRHRAAIGISEQVDVLVLVVSEETGKISVVEDGSIETDLSLTLLQERIQKYYQGAEK